LERCPARVVGVTGSAGKSTTAAMLSAMLGGDRLRGRCFLGGNIGGSLLDDVGAMCADDDVVLELSSFQLSAIARVGRVLDGCIVTTIQPTHLDWHGSFDAYVEAKLEVVRGSVAGASVVVGRLPVGMLDRIRSVANGVGASVIESGDVGSPVGLGVSGEHNVENAKCAVAMCRAWGVAEGAIGCGLGTYSGLPHRLNRIATVGGVDFVNDSKATTLHSTVVGLRAIDRPVVLLLGGRMAAVDLDGIALDAFSGVRAVFSFGEAGRWVSERLVPLIDPGGEMLHRCCASMGECVVGAAGVAVAGDTVLLSPGFQSYDEYTNYEARGDAFCRLVLGLSSDL
jgi:UDP-N-acetylmuramoylalanine--D-glutamate ligase